MASTSLDSVGIVFLCLPSGLARTEKLYRAPALLTLLQHFEEFVAFDEWRFERLRRTGDGLTCESI
jgi:hypothetical protein